MLSDLWEGVPLKVDTNQSVLDRELKRIVNRYRIIDSLQQRHSSLRDTLAPLFWDLCPAYFSLKQKLKVRDRHVHDSILLAYMESKPDTPNRRFLEELLNNRADTINLAPEQVMAPVYNFRIDSAGIYLDNLSMGHLPELDLLMKAENVPDSLKLNWDYGFAFFPQVLDSVFPVSPRLWLYSKTGKNRVEVVNLARFQDECNDFIYYHLNSDSQALTGQEWMFTSPFLLELSLGNYPQIDRIISAQYPDICSDCPNSWSHQHSFARLEEYENIYFTYAAEPETKLDEGNTPLRAVFYVRDSLVIPIWGTSIDRFGCSCL